MRRSVYTLLSALLVVVLLAACGGGTTPVRSTPAPTTVNPTPPAPAGTNTCPEAAAGHGSMGACAPKAKLGLTLPGSAAPSFGASPTYPDVSNNQWVGCTASWDFGAIARAGHPAIYGKTNQGTGFTDCTFPSVVAKARAAGLAPGGYDFVSTYTAAEAYRFVAILRANGTCTSAKTLPPALDVEYGAATRSGVQTMANIVKAACGRVAVYTGSWYWSPHLGCWWPSGGVTGWISGYPTASAPCGLNYTSWLQHQYSDSAWNGAGTSDMSVYQGAARGTSFASFARLAAPTPTAVLNAHELRLIAAYKPNATPARRDAALDPIARQIRTLRRLGLTSTQQRKARYTLLVKDFNAWSTASYLVPHERDLVHGYYGSSSATRRSTLAKLVRQRDLITHLAHQPHSGGYGAHDRGPRRQWLAGFAAHRGAR